MTDSPSAPDAPRGPLAVLGAIVVRLVVPAWILAGAWVKMQEAAPSFLPRQSIITPARALDIDLQWLLAVLVSIEFVIAFAMILIPRLARPLAIMVLTLFCGILIHEMLRGSTSCGCFGSKSPPPAAMLAIDGVLLLAAILLRPARETFLPGAPRWIVTAVLGLAMTVMSIRVVDPGGEVARMPADADAEPAAGQPRNPAPQPLPGYWVSENLGDLVGRPWTDLPLVGFMDLWPSVPAEGDWFLTFYGRTCDECRKLFNEVLVDERFARRTTAIEVPYDTRTLRPDEGTWDLPAVDGLQMLSLPVGPDWVLTTPLDVRIRDGVIVAISEGGSSPEGATGGGSPEAPHGPVWDMDPASLEAAPAAGDAPAAGGDDASAGGDSDAPPTAATAGRFDRRNPDPAPLPQWWFSEDLPSWIGRDWREFTLFSFMPTWPTVPTSGTHHVVFYRRDCDHCREMFEQDFRSDEALARSTTAIEVPYDKSTMTPPNAWRVPTTAVESMQMPLGPDYIITTPLAIRIEDGVITCIEEGDHATCLGTGG
ncbi:MAG: MauE/DoxX family redox-associated membrane protein [Planctomycetota bacterium]|jgi:hypothetical protein